MRTLFLVGNKRSGTSQLVRLLNLHPHIFVSHESDIAWILYQFHHGQPFKVHPWDSERGMRLTLDLVGKLLRADATPEQNFMALQTRLMEQGTPWLPAQHKTDLAWIGDKKPLQHMDPQVLEFLLKHFPDARFLHLVRHPLEVVASSDQFNKTSEGDFWLGLSPEQKLEQWAIHEQQAIQLRKSLPGRVHSLRFEDLCRHTKKEMSRLFAFLEVEADENVLREAARQTVPPARPSPWISCSEETNRVAAEYGYSLRQSRSRTRAWMNTIYWRMAKRLGG